MGRLRLEEKRRQNNNLPEREDGQIHAQEPNVRFWRCTPADLVREGKV